MVHVDFEEINHAEPVKIYGPDNKKLIARVLAEGTTRVISIGCGFIEVITPGSNSPSPNPAELNTKVATEDAYVDLMEHDQIEILEDFLQTSPLLNTPK